MKIHRSFPVPTGGSNAPLISKNPKIQDISSKSEFSTEAGSKYLILGAGVLGTCFSVWLRREVYDIYYFISPFHFVLIILVLLAFIFLCQWLSCRRRIKTPQIVHLVLYIFSISVVGLVRHSLFEGIAVGAIASTCMMMNASGAGGDNFSSETIGAIINFPDRAPNLEEEVSSFPLADAPNPNVAGEGAVPPQAVPAREPAPEPGDNLSEYRGEVRLKLGIFLSKGSSQSVQRSLYDRAWALIDGESAEADKLLALDLKIQELTLREGLPPSAKKRLELLLEEADGDD